MPKGGKRPGSGVKPRSGEASKNRSIKFTDAEWKAIKQLAEQQNTTSSEYIRDKALGEK